MDGHRQAADFRLPEEVPALVHVEDGDAVVGLGHGWSIHPHVGAEEVKVLGLQRAQSRRARRGLPGHHCAW